MAVLQLEAVRTVQEDLTAAKYEMVFTYSSVPYSVWWDCELTSEARSHFDRLATKNLGRYE